MRFSRLLTLSLLLAVTARGQMLLSQATYTPANQTTDHVARLHLTGPPRIVNDFLKMTNATAIIITADIDTNNWPLGSATNTVTATALMQVGQNNTVASQMGVITIKQTPNFHSEEQSDGNGGRVITFYTQQQWQDNAQQ